VLGRSSSSSFSLVAEEQTVADDDVVAFDRLCNLLLSLGREEDDDDERREENALVDANALISSPRKERLRLFAFSLSFLVRASRLCARRVVKKDEVYLIFSRKGERFLLKINQRHKNQI